LAVKVRAAWIGRGGPVSGVGVDDDRYIHPRQTWRSIKVSLV
jgi:hypothetical protein